MYPVCIYLSGNSKICLGKNNKNFIPYGQCPKISNTLFHSISGLNFAFYAVISKNTYWNGK